MFKTEAVQVLVGIGKEPGPYAQSSGDWGLSRGDMRG